MKKKAQPLPNTMPSNRESSKVTPPSAPQEIITPLKDIFVNVEYVKNMNIQIPNAPKIFSHMPPQPLITISIDVNAQQLAENKPSFEVVVIANCVGNAEQEDKEIAVFNISLQYAAIVTLPTLKASNLQELLMVHTPDLLFPEIRNLILNTTRSSNLHPVMLQRIDFAGLWHDKKAQAAKQH